MHVLLIDVPHDNGVEEYSALTAVCQQRYYAGDATTLSGYGTGIQLVLLPVNIIELIQLLYIATVKFVNES